MGFDDLWKKFGERVENGTTEQSGRTPERIEPQRSPERRQPERTPERRQPERTPERTQPQRTPERRQPERTPNRTEPQRTQERKIKNTQTTNVLSPGSSYTENSSTSNNTNVPGVFGSESDIPRSNTGSTRNRTDISERLREVSWIDIAGISITVILVLLVIFNFETVTTAIFNFILPILSSLFSLLLTVGVIMFVIWWFRRGRRR